MILGLAANAQTSGCNSRKYHTHKLSKRCRVQRLYALVPTAARISAVHTTARNRSLCRSASFGQPGIRISENLDEMTSRTNHNMANNCLLFSHFDVRSYLSTSAPTSLRLRPRFRSTISFSSCSCFSLAAVVADPFFLFFPFDVPPAE